MHKAGYISERRQFRRIPANLSVSYNAAAQVKAGVSLTKDISQAGISFFVNEHIPKNTVFDLKLALKGSDLFIEVSEIVKWVKEGRHAGRFEVGVEFINISDKEMKYLIDYISKSASRQ